MTKGQRHKALKLLRQYEVNKTGTSFCESNTPLPNLTLTLEIFLINQQISYPRLWHCIDTRTHSTMGWPHFIFWKVARPRSWTMSLSRTLPRDWHWTGTTWAHRSWTWFRSHSSPGSLFWTHMRSSDWRWPSRTKISSRAWRISTLGAHGSGLGSWHRRSRHFRSWRTWMWPSHGRWTWKKSNARPSASISSTISQKRLWWHNAKIEFQALWAES